ncbi:MULTISPECIES: putative bifunctional diguanylate cyclase/phosphodiesterase [Cobetia]|uniref:EAL domain-containing protein n=1 Tax=Cobetia crustatorum TaxID=553385 RepID=A0A558HGS8_9GAMM|nr:MULTISPECIES: GGDEF domain-containing phosphodiesterase [Cobetia]TVU68314.1 EAL domain-containing protein [Cobetia crustatorum]
MDPISPRDGGTHSLWRIFGINAALLVVLGGLYLASQWFDVREQEMRRLEALDTQLHISTEQLISDVAREMMVLERVLRGESDDQWRGSLESALGRHPSLVSLIAVPFADYRGSSLRQIGVGRSCSWQLSQSEAQALPGRSSLLFGSALPLASGQPGLPFYRYMDVEGMPWLIIGCLDFSESRSLLANPGSDEGQRLRLFSTNGLLLFSSPQEHALGITGKLPLSSLASMGKYISERGVRRYHVPGFDGRPRMAAGSYIAPLKLFSVVSQPVSTLWWYWWQRTWFGLLLGGIFLVVLVVVVARAERQRGERHDELEGALESMTARSRTLITLMDNLPGVVYRIEVNTGVLTFISSGAAELFGRSAESLVGAGVTLSELIHQEDRQAVSTARHWAMCAQMRHEQVFRIIADHERWVLERSVMIEGEDGVRYWEGLLLDISAHKESERQLDFLARHDALTGLHNRKAFMAAADENVAVGGLMIYADIDRFSTVNDGLGHEAGDQLLVSMGERLRRLLPPGGLVARLGADEFGLYLPHGNEHPAQVVEELQQKIERPFTILGRPLIISLTAGYALAESGGDAQALMLNADVALYHAKSRGDHALCWESSLDKHVASRMTLEQDLRQAIDRDQLYLHYQPQLNAEGELLGVEALLRWQHPELGMISPAQFIPLAEETGLIFRLGRFVLEEACAQMVRWQEVGLHMPRMAVNLSARQLTSGYEHEVISVLESQNLSPTRLEVEVTETLLIQDMEGGLAVLNALRELGVRVALDDFGQGYSSLSYLSSLPLDVLKVDRSFVMKMDALAIVDSGNRCPNHQATQLIGAIISLGHSLGHEIVAEGVETEAQFEGLKQLGCDSYQGFLLARPMSADAIVERFMTVS